MKQYNYKFCPVVVSIPQAVSTVATQKKPWYYAVRKGVSIPQAVSTVATHIIAKAILDAQVVSIPQAVSTVATM